MASEVASPWNLSIRDRMREVNPFLCVLIALFASASWIELYGLTVELPFLVRYLPEGWNLPSYVVIIANCSVVFPLVYMTIIKCCSFNRRRREVVTVYVIMTGGAVACILLSFLWDKTVFINGEERSLVFLALCAMLCMVDTVATVSFYPFMDRFKPHYMPYYIAGEESGGLLAGLMGIAQGVGADVTCMNQSMIVTNETTGENVTVVVQVPDIPPPNFSVSAFMLFLGGMLILSITCFTIMNFASFAKRHMIPEDGTTSLGDEMKEEKGMANPAFNSNEKKSGEIILTAYNPKSGTDNSTVNTSNLEKKGDAKQSDNPKVVIEPIPNKPVNKRRLIAMLLVGSFGTYMVFGINPAMQPFTCLPYGNLAYTLTIRMCTIMNPLAALFAFVVPTNSLKIMTFCSLLGSSIIAFFIYLASTSPTPPLQGHPAGSFLVIFLSVVATTTYVYSRANIAATMRLEGGPNGTMYAGISLQVGSVLGGITGFIMINVAELFESIPMCPT